MWQQKHEKCIGIVDQVANFAWGGGGAAKRIPLVSVLSPWPKLVLGEQLQSMSA